MLKILQRCRFSRVIYIHEISSCTHIIKCENKAQKKIPCLSISRRNFAAEAKKNKILKGEEEENLENKEEDELEDISAIDISSEEDSDREEILQYFIDKAEYDMEFDFPESENFEMMTVDQKMYFKIVDLWMEESGRIKKNYHDFIKVLLRNMNKFDVQHNVNAYLKLLDCFPQGEHTEIKRNNFFEKGFKDKRPAHELGVEIFRTMKFNNVEPVESMYVKSLDLFGRWSIATRQIRMWMFWSARFKNLNPYPIPMLEVNRMSPIELSFHVTRQMNPGLETLYKKIKISNCEDNFLISSQTRQQTSSLANHDTTEPLHVEGPRLVYFQGKRIHYYVLCKDPIIKTKNKEEIKSILTDKSWWEEFYGREFETGRKITKKGTYFENDELVMPKLKMEAHIGKETQRRTKETTFVENDTKAVESEVFAIAGTTASLESKTMNLLREWISTLQKSNPILSEVTISFRQPKTFLLETGLNPNKKNSNPESNEI